MKDKNENCFKCGARFGFIKYHQESVWPTACDIHLFSKDENEHLHYYCNICGYDWIGPIKNESNDTLNELTKL